MATNRKFIGGAASPVYVVNEQGSVVDFTTTLEGQVAITATNGDPVVATEGSLGVILRGADQDIPISISSNNLDAGARLRVSNLTTLGDYKSVDSDNALYYDIQGTGTAAHSTANAWYNLSVAEGEWVVMQTFQFHNYSSGKSHLPEFTFTNFQPEEGVIKRAGYFSSSTSSPHTADYDGIYLESSTGTVKFVVDRYGVNTTTVAQAAWDDPLDGNGRSGKTVNWENFLPIFIDFLWLGGTRVRLWVVIDGALILAHTYEHSNNEAFTMIRQPSQPIRFEIRSTTGTGTFRPICAAVSTEGALGPVGTIRAANNGATQCDADVAGTVYAVLGLRLKAANRHDSIDVVNVEVLSGSNDAFLWELRLNPTVAGTFTYNAITASSAEYALGDTPNTVSGGYLVASGYGGAQSRSVATVESARRLGSTLAGVMDTLVLCATPLSAGLDVYGSITWRELR